MTESIKLPPPAPLDPRLYELLAMIKTWADEERLASRRYSREATEEANRCAFERAASLAAKAAISDGQANGLSISAVELRDTLNRLASEQLYRVSPPQTITEAIAES
jgi:hypothetical protein